MSRTTNELSSTQEYLSPAQFSALAGLSLPTVRRYLGNGKLPKVQLGGKRCRIVIPRSALAATIGAQPALTIGTETATTPPSRDRESKQGVRSGPPPRWTRTQNTRNP